MADAILSDQGEPRGQAADPAVLPTAGAAGSVQPRRDAVLVGAPARARERLQRAAFPTEHTWRAERYRLALHHVILKLLFSTGMRPCEIVGLEPQDVDHERLKLRVRAKGKQRHLAQQRSVFITARTAHQLQELVGQSAAVRSGASQDRLLIHYRGGRPLARTT